MAKAGFQLGNPLDSFTIRNEACDASFSEGILLSQGDLLREERAEWAQARCGQSEVESNTPWWIRYSRARPVSAAGR